MNKLPSSIQQFKQLVELKDYRPPTKAAYVRAVWKVVEHFECEPATLSQDQLRQYFLFLREEQQASPSVMKMTKWALRCYYRECVKVAGWTVFDEVRIAPVRTLPTVLARAEVQRLLAAVREPRFATSLRLMYYCGLRVGEVVRLEVGDIKSQETPPRLHIRNAKGGKDRFVPLFPALLAELRQWWHQHQNPKLLFPARPRGSERDPAVRAALRTTHRPLEAAAVQEAFRLARLEAGVTTAATTHTLRHSYATHLLESGVSLRQISAYLGHESLDTTAIYCHLTVATEARTQEVLAGLYQPPQA